MSALGDYIHLRKFNYNKYGTARISGRSEIENNTLFIQTNYWRARRELITKRFRSVSQVDELEGTLQESTNQLKEYMEQLEKGTSKDILALKQQILQKVLKEQYSIATQLIHFNFATGKVSSLLQGENSNILDTNTQNFLAKLAQNDQRVYVDENTEDSYLDLKQLLTESLNACQQYFDKFRQQKLSKKDAKDMNKKYKEVEKYLKQAFKNIQSMDDMYEIQHSINKNGVTTNKKYIRTNFYLKYAADGIIEAMNLMKVPNLSVIKGSFMEELYASFINQGKSLGVTLACESLGEAQTKGSTGKWEIFPAAAQLMKNQYKKGKNTLKINKQYDKEYKDKVIKATFEYNYSSQRKADARLNVEVEENQETAFKNIGISIKNYQAQNMHLVTDSLFTTFLLGGEFTANEVNNLLNIFAKYESGGEKIIRNSKNESDAALVGFINAARQSAAAALKLMILYSAASGANVGKGVENIADYILLNQPNKPKDPPKIVSIKRLVASLFVTQTIGTSEIVD